MKRFVLTAAFYILILASCVFAQSPDDYVRNSKTIPDFLDQNSGWSHDPAEDQIDGGHVIESHENKKEGLIVFLYIDAAAAVLRKGSELAYMAEYGSKQVGRAAIKVDGKWYVGRAPFYDNGKGMPENSFKSQDILDSNGRLVGVKLMLETVDGLKELVISIQ